MLERVNNQFSKLMTYENPKQANHNFDYINIGFNLGYWMEPYVLSFQRLFCKTQVALRQSGNLEACLCLKRNASNEWLKL